MRYAYPAIFTPEAEGGFSVVFPDLESCYTCGDNMADALIMAEDVLALTLYGYEKEHKTIPIPSQRKEIDTEDESFVNFVSCDTLEYRKKFSNKAVKKTLTIPAWLNEMAAESNVNFSTVLQEALKKYLGV